LIADRPRWWHAFTARAWVLLLPLFGFALADTLLVHPPLREARTEGERVTRTSTARASHLGLQVSQARVGAQRAQAAIEERFRPQLEHGLAAIDSLRLRRRGAQAGLAACRVRIDSLRALQQGLAASAERAERERAERDAVLADLRARRAGLEDSLITLEQLLARTGEQLGRQQTRHRQREVLDYVWYVLGPCLGAIWAQDS